MMWTKQLNNKILIKIKNYIKVYHIAVDNTTDPQLQNDAEMLTQKQSNQYCLQIIVSSKVC